MRIKVSPAQHRALEAIDDGGLTTIGTVIYLGRQRTRILDALETRGLVRYHPRADHGKGVWKITPAGRAVLGQDTGGF